MEMSILLKPTHPHHPFANWIYTALRSKSHRCFVQRAEKDISKVVQAVSPHLCYFLSIVVNNLKWGIWQERKTTFSSSLTFRRICSCTKLKCNPLKTHREIALGTVDLFAFWANISPGVKSGTTFYHEIKITCKNEKKILVTEMNRNGDKLAWH